DTASPQVTARDGHAGTDAVAIVDRPGWTTVHQNAILYCKTWTRTPAHKPREPRQAATRRGPLTTEWNGPIDGYRHCTHPHRAASFLQSRARSRPLRAVHRRLLLARPRRRQPPPGRAPVGPRHRVRPRPRARRRRAPPPRRDPAPRW